MWHVIGLEYIFSQTASTASCCPLSLFNLRKNQLDFRLELLIKNDHKKERYLHFCGYYTYIIGYYNNLVRITNHLLTLDTWVTLPTVWSRHWATEFFLGNFSCQFFIYSQSFWKKFVESPKKYFFKPAFIGYNYSGYWTMVPCLRSHHTTH